ncbi:hypothetical protein [Paraburkholderia atlantica]|uniref:hypothetical protein n=1 Tax=Paraburkholderia atlantica TaxID=2654982 RepID=UPI001621C338|nr:hypothetical protein [Paraburkholderia atlantica]
MHYSLVKRSQLDVTRRTGGFKKDARLRFPVAAEQVAYVDVVKGARPMKAGSFCPFFRLP